MVDFPESAIFIFFSFFKELCPSFIIEFYLILNGQYGQYLVELCHLNSFSLIHKTHSFTWISLWFSNTNMNLNISHRFISISNPLSCLNTVRQRKRARCHFISFYDKWTLDTFSSGWWWSWPGCWLWCSPRPRPSSSGNKIK